MPGSGGTPSRRVPDAPDAPARHPDGNVPGGNRLLSQPHAGHGRLPPRTGRAQPAAARPSQAPSQLSFIDSSARKARSAASQSRSRRQAWPIRSCRFGKVNLLASAWLQCSSAACGLRSARSTRANPSHYRSLFPAIPKALNDTASLDRAIQGDVCLEKSLVCFGPIGSLPNKGLQQTDGLLGLANQ